MATDVVIAKNYLTKEELKSLEVLDNSGKVSHKVAESFALSEFEKYRIVQDRLFESDFDKFIIEMKNEEINN